MLTADDVRTRARQQPFSPFRITTSAGEEFDVTHPDLIMVGRRDVVIGLANQPTTPIYDRLARISILHITSLRDLPLPSNPTPSNGAA
jgi:hypothetical protein